MKMKKILFLTIMLGILITMVNRVNATIITYDLTNLGGNRWEYSYSVTNDSMSSPIEEFTIYFDLELYENLLVGNTLNDWDAIVVQPDPEPDFEADGFYDALALLTGIAPGETVSGFTVSFDWLVTGLPGYQFFEVVDPSNLEALDSGWTVTTTSVPEPGTLLLLGSGLLGLIGIGKRLRVKPRFQRRLAMGLISFSGACCHAFYHMRRGKDEKEY